MVRWARLGVLAVALLSACAGMTEQTRQREIAGLVQSLQGAAQRGEVGTVEGYLYLMEPAISTPLPGWSVTMIPLTPTLEDAVNRAKQRFLTRVRAPFSARELDLARRPITDHIKTLTAAGHADMIRTVNTTDSKADPKFIFQDVPQGRWLLLAELPSKISVLLWAVPVTVGSGKTTWQSLNDSSVWLEGLTP